MFRISGYFLFFTMGVCELELTSRERFGVGNNKTYLKKYNSRECCRGASFYFLEKVLSGEIIDVNNFNIREIALKHKRYIHEKRKHDLDNVKINLLDTELLLERYSGQVDSFKWMNTNPGEAGAIKSELQAIVQTLRCVCGTIHLRDHAMAYACNSSHIYLFDPDYGLLKFQRNSTGVQDFFNVINERNNIRSLSIITQSKELKIL